MKIAHLSFRTHPWAQAHCHHCGQSLHLAVARFQRGPVFELNPSARLTSLKRIRVRSGPPVDCSVARAFAIAHAHGLTFGPKPAKPRRRIVLRGSAVAS